MLLLSKPESNHSVIPNENARPLSLLSLVFRNELYAHLMSFNTVRKLPEDSLSFSITCRDFILCAKFQPGVNF